MELLGAFAGGTLFGLALAVVGWLCARARQARGVPTDIDWINGHPDVQGGEP